MSSRRRAALLAVGIALFSACRTAPEPPDAHTTDAARSAGIDVLADGCGPTPDEGSGSMIDDDLAITAAHVVAGATEVRVVAADDAIHGAEVVYFDPELDLAALRTAQPIGAPLRIGSPAETDDRGVIVRFDEADGHRSHVASQVRVLRTVNIDTTDIYLERDVTRRGFEVDAEIESGDSGAVVVLPGGIAGGMIWAKSTERGDRAWAIDLPEELGDAGFRASLVDAVPVDRCTD